MTAPDDPRGAPVDLAAHETSALDESNARACDSFLVAVVAVAELYALPFVWQALPMGMDFAADTRAEDWAERRVLRAPAAD